MGLHVKWQPLVGEPVLLTHLQLADLSMLSDTMLERITSVLVEGAELETLARKVFSGNHPSVPWCFNATSQTWYGDHAKFIVANCF